MREPIEEVKDKIVPLLRRYDVVHAAVFGSFIRGEMKQGSDIDILVKFSRRKSLLDLVRIERELSEVLDLKVDLVTEGSVSPYMIDHIRKELKVIYDEKG